MRLCICPGVALMHVRVVRRTVPRVSVFRISFHIHPHCRQSPNTVLPANLKHMLYQTKRVDRVGTTAYRAVARPRFKNAWALLKTVSDARASPFTTKGRRGDGEGKTVGL